MNKGEREEGENSQKEKYTKTQARGHVAYEGGIIDLRTVKKRSIKILTPIPSLSGTF